MNTRKKIISIIAFLIQQGMQISMYGVKKRYFQLYNENLIIENNLLIRNTILEFKMAGVISSSHGNLLYNRESGLVLYINANEDSYNEYFSKITKIDIREYCDYYKTDVIPKDIDILNVGYWCTNLYEPAEKDWREELKIN